MNALKNVDLTCLESITLDTDDLTATVVLNVPVGPSGEIAPYEEIIDFSIAGDTALSELQAKARAFAEAMVEFIAERGATKTAEPKCVTCTGACCGRVYSEVHVTQVDVGTLKGAGTGLERGVELYPGGERFNGYVGML